MNTLSSSKENRSDIILWLAFAAVYILWGSTYLALRFALESMPPFLISALRFMLAGTIMLLLAKYHKQPWPSRKEIRNAMLVGFLLLVIANGCVVWASQFIDSGITALIVTIEPVWVVLLLWMKSNDHKPPFIVWLGILFGIAGMLILIGPSSFNQVDQLNPWAVLALLASSMSWAIGSVYALRIPLPASSSISTGIQMFFAGIMMFLLSNLRGEWTGFEFSQITERSWGGFLYLVIFGSLLGFTSYSYIVRKASPTSASTHAYVNPVIAVFLGWWIGNERVSMTTLFAALLLVLAVVIIIMKPDLKLNFNFKRIKS